MSGRRLLRRLSSRHETNDELRRQNFPPQASSRSAGRTGVTAAGALVWLATSALNEQWWAERDEELQERAAYTAPLVQHMDEDRAAWLASWKRKKRKRRKKKLPKASSSRSLLARAAHTWRPGHYSPRAPFSVCLVPSLGVACGLRVASFDSGYTYMRQSSWQLGRRLPSLCA